MSTQTCINIVADGPKYTAMADLLISSIYASHGQDPQVQIVVGVPEDQPEGHCLRNRSWGSDIEVLDLPAPTLVDSRKNMPYRHFNKIELLEASASVYPGSHHLFLDSDLVLMRRLPLSYLSQHAIAAMPVHYYGWLGDWSKLYKGFKNSRTSLSIASSGYSVGPAYYNAGVIWVHKAYASSLRWRDAALEIYEQHGQDESMHLFPWLDQLSLPFAAGAMSIRIYELSDCMNMLCDKLLMMHKAAELLPKNSFMPRTPFIVHHHGNIIGMEEAINICRPRLRENPDFEESLSRLLAMERDGSIQANRVV